MKETQSQFHHRLDGTTDIPNKPPVDPAQPHPRHKEAMQLLERFQNGRNKGISIDIRSIATALRKDVEVHSIPEPVFVQHFLPLFAGEIQETEALNYTTWIEKVAGSDRAPVNVIDLNYNVLFVVPPLLDASVIEQTTSGGSGTMSRIERQYSRLKEIDAGASQIYLEKMLKGSHLKEKPTQQVIDNVKTWNEIFRRYGREDKIITLGNILDLDTKKEAPGIGGGINPSPTDVSDYELDTD